MFHELTNQLVCATRESFCVVNKLLIPVKKDKVKHTLMVHEKYTCKLQMQDLKVRIIRRKMSR
ncbi:hypothetical protein Hanom_Chr08g00754091 [Helianthus anomalus]